jgi:hypothetical protein
LCVITRGEIVIEEKSTRILKESIRNLLHISPFVLIAQGLPSIPFARSKLICERVGAFEAPNYS